MISAPLELEWEAFGILIPSIHIHLPEKPEKECGLSLI